MDGAKIDLLFTHILSIPLRLLLNSHVYRLAFYPRPNAIEKRYYLSRDAYKLLQTQRGS